MTKNQSNNTISSFNIVSYPTLCSHNLVIISATNFMMLWCIKEGFVNMTVCYLCFVLFFMYIPIPSSFHLLFSFLLLRPNSCTILYVSWRLCMFFILSSFLLVDLPCINPIDRCHCLPWIVNFQIFFSAHQQMNVLGILELIRVTNWLINRGTTLPLQEFFSSSKVGIATMLFSLCISNIQNYLSHGNNIKS